MDDLIQQLMLAMNGTSQDDTGFRIGDSVQIDLPQEIVEEMQSGHGEWVDQMSQVLGVRGSILFFIESDCMVEFDNGMKFRVNSNILSRSAQTPSTSNRFSTGDIVRIDANPDQIDSLQKNFGGSNVLMQGLAGMYGYVIRTNGRQFIVRNGPRKWSWNPKLLTKVTQEDLDRLEKENEKVTRLNFFDIVHIIDNVEQLQRNQTNYGGWVDPMKELRNQYGVVKLLLPNGSVRVQVQGRKWVLNPRSCRLVVKAVNCTNELSNKRVKAPLEDLYDIVSILVKSLSANSIFRCVMDGDCQKFETEILSGSYNINETLDSYSVLHVAAACCSNVNMLSSILNASPAMLNLSDKDGHKPIHLAAAAGNLDNLQFLLKKDSSTISARNNGGRSPLHLAVCKKSLSCVRALVLAGAPINMKETETGDTPLHEAIEYGAEEVGLYLIEQGASLHAENKHHFSPFFLSAFKGTEELFRGILQSSNMSDTRAQYSRHDGVTVAHILAVNNHHVLLSALLGKYPKFELCKIDMNGMSPLHLACNQGHFEAVKVLLRFGADPNLRDFDSDTPLHLCIISFLKKKGNLLEGDKSQRMKNIAKFLVTHGADPYISNNKGDTPLELASIDNEFCIDLIGRYDAYITKKSPEELLSERATSSTERTTAQSSGTMQMGSMNQSGTHKVKTRYSQFMNEEDKTCRICYENDCDMLMSCMHSICRACLDRLTNHECPFCRREILDEIQIPSEPTT